ncbi:unnamed protein product [Pocillopora meandrina]|uniref:Transferrin-like domain-containing protein n=1 Tax=Pocillopora meandrina TaxID=46732 RepID=A0AAU9W254_9CNID|nr:unnamed protein product [Pocillopora meandrina]
MERILIVLMLFITVHYAYSGPISFRWCALSHERAKCSNFTNHVKMMAQTMNLNVAASCVNGNSADDCIKKIIKKEADLVTLDGGNIHEAGKSHDFKVIVAEQYGEYGVKYYAVAVVRKNNTGFDLKSLRGKKSCHTGAGRTAGWKVAVGFLLRSKIMPAVACGNESNAYLSAAKFFEESCVPGTPSKVSSGVYQMVSNLCNLCAGPENDKCTTDTLKNRYVGYHGAFMCMAEGKGDVAFVKYTTTEEVAAGGKYGKPEDYEYLCPTGGRMAVGTHTECHLGANPAHAVVTRGNNSDIGDIIKILTKMSETYGVKQTDWKKFQLFNSSQYSGNNLLFKDSTTALNAQPAGKQSVMDYLGKSYGENVDSLTSCDTTTSTTLPPPPASSSTAILPVSLLVLFTALLDMFI